MSKCIILSGKPSPDNINHVYEQNKTILHMASERGETEMVKKLVAISVLSVDKVDSKGLTPLGHAVNSNNGDLANVLIQGSSLTNVYR